ncbi:MAG: PfkB family carbohydrate kinase [Anaerolineales bacterium]|nr:PfkB family carbohydrate kinase [Anaerolineales bacterium]
MSNFDILMIGNIAKDKLIVDGVEEIASGGGVYYGSVVVKRLGAKVGVITRLHPDDYQLLEELRSEGVEVFSTPADGTSGIANYYQSSNMETRICIPIGFGGKYNLDEIPDLPTRVILITPLFAGEVDLPILQALSERAPVGVDIQGFVRVPVGDELIFQPWADMAEGLKCITYLKVDKAEAEFLTGSPDLQEAALKLQSLGPKEIVITQSSGVTVLAEGKFYTAPFNARSLAGRTGRGDTCFSTYITKRLTENPETACRWAGIVTSLKQEVPGPWKGTIEIVQNELNRS